MNANYKLIAVLALVGVVVIFVIQNTAVVEVRVLFWTVSMSRSLMFFLMLCIGIGIGWFLRGRLKSQATR